MPGEWAKFGWTYDDKAVGWHDSRGHDVLIDLVLILVA